MKRSIRLLLVALITAAALAAGLVSNPASAWAPAGTAAIHPGVQTRTDGAQCTANFIFTAGNSTYIGQAAHCSSTGTETNGCLASSLPLGTKVEVGGASELGVLVYNSWLAMQAADPPETDPDTCAYNDFALIKLDPGDVKNVNPSIPHWGGPNGLNTTGVLPLQKVYGYGNSSLATPSPS